MPGTEVCRLIGHVSWLIKIFTICKGQFHQYASTHTGAGFQALLRQMQWLRVLGLGMHWQQFRVHLQHQSGWAAVKTPGHGSLDMMSCSTVNSTPQDSATIRAVSLSSRLQLRLLDAEQTILYELCKTWPHL